jgi:trans-aconitate methyltransferase
MHRQLEPELMEDAEQVKAYAEADFETPHGLFMELLRKRFNRPTFHSTALDLGCGPGDISRRFACAYPEACVDALDGSKAMLNYAKLLLSNELAARINFIHAKLPVGRLPQPGYAVIFSNSLLHHLPDPQVLWSTLKQFALPRTFVAVMDLLRPASVDEARRLVVQHACGEPAILQADFYASLLAAFTPDEIAAQLVSARLDLHVQEVGDRHVFISGLIP